MITERPDTANEPVPYVSLVPKGDLVAVYQAQVEQMRDLKQRLTDEKATFRYADGKWSVKQVIGHVTDTERVCAYRLLCATRGDANLMPSFDEDAYVTAAHFDDRSLEDLFSDWETTRAATMSLLRSLRPEMLQNTGCHNGKPTTALAVACIIAGHLTHHLDILRDRYGI